MKKILFGIFVFAMAAGFATSASASYIQYGVDVDFFVVDSNSSGSVTVKIFDFFGSTLQYSLDGTSWNPAGSSVNFNMTPGGELLTMWQSGTDPEPDRVGDLEFFGAGVGPDGLYGSVQIAWDEGAGEKLTLEIADDGHLKPAATPITHSAVLLGSGLFGLLVFSYRRKSSQK